MLLMGRMPLSGTSLPTALILCILESQMLIYVIVDIYCSNYPTLSVNVLIHDYYSLYEEYSLRGFHINKNLTSYPADYQGTRTRSCHSFDEVVRYKPECDYLFLSPIFDSISKADYRSKFSHAELLNASINGVIDNKVIALGGVTLDRIAYLHSLRFGGVAMMGAIDDIMPF